jgi:antitoxin YefM
MIALDDFESLTETAYLLRSPRNTRRLLDSIKELEEGKGIERALAE